MSQSLDATPATTTRFGESSKKERFTTPFRLHLKGSNCLRCILLNAVISSHSSYPDMGPQGRFAVAIFFQLSGFFCTFSMTKVPRLDLDRKKHGFIFQFGGLLAWALLWSAKRWSLFAFTIILSMIPEYFAYGKLIGTTLNFITHKWGCRSDESGFCPDYSMHPSLWFVSILFLFLLLAPYAVLVLAHIPSTRVKGGLLGLTFIADIFCWRYVGVHDWPWQSYMAAEGYAMSFAQAMLAGDLCKTYLHRRYQKDQEQQRLLDLVADPETPETESSVAEAEKRKQTRGIGSRVVDALKIIGANIVMTFVAFWYWKVAQIAKVQGLHAANYLNHVHLVTIIYIAMMITRTGSDRTLVGKIMSNRVLDVHFGNSGYPYCCYLMEGVWLTVYHWGVRGGPWIRTSFDISIAFLAQAYFTNVFVPISDIINKSHRKLNTMLVKAIS